MTIHTYLKEKNCVKPDVRGGGYVGGRCVGGWVGGGGGLYVGGGGTDVRNWSKNAVFGHFLGKYYILAAPE